MRYDILVLATGAITRPARRPADTVYPGDRRHIHAVLKAVERGRVKRIAIVVPPQPSWPLPAYELAFLLSHEIWNTGHDDVAISLVTPEPEPLSMFGESVSPQVEAELAAAGIYVEAGACAELCRGHPIAMVLQPGERRLDVSRVLAQPEIWPREIPGVPSGLTGFVDVDEHCRCRGLDDVYAAGDVTSLPLKHGSLAVEQADVASRHIAHRAGAPLSPTSLEPVLRGRLLIGGRDAWLRHMRPRRRGREQIAKHRLWWPPALVAGPRIAQRLAEVGLARDAAHVPCGREVALRIPFNSPAPAPARPRTQPQTANDPPTAARTDAAST